MDGDHARVRKGNDRRRFEAREERLELAEPIGRGVHHHVLAVARGNHGADHRVECVDFQVTARIHGRAHDENGLGFQNVLDGAKAVHRQRRPGRNEIDDRLREAQPRGHLNGARQRDDVDRDAASFKEPARDSRMRRGDPMPREVFGALDLTARGNRDGEPATSVSEVARNGERGTGLCEQVRTRDPEVGDAVVHELGNIGCPNEEDVQRKVLDTRDEASIVLVEHETGSMEQGKAGFDEPSLVWNGQADALANQDEATRSSIRR